MRRAIAWLISASLVGGASDLWAASARAGGAPRQVAEARKPKKKAKVEIVAIAWKDGESSANKERLRHVRGLVRRAAVQALKHLDFGEHGRLEVTIAIKELTMEESDGVLRVSCTMVGRLKGGGSARSKISFGGKPDQKKKIERQVLSSVTEGVMVRLAELARARDKERAEAEIDGDKKRGS